MRSRSSLSAKAVNWYRPAAVGMTVLFLAIAVVMLQLRWRAFSEAGFLGVDYDLVIITARRFFDTGSMYFAYQLEGPYVLQPPPYTADIMPGIYPPHAIYLFAPFLVLPAVLWWAIPLAMIAYVLVLFRPAPWTWPVMAAILALPDTISPLIVGNTTMWLVAIVAAGLQWHGVAVLVSLKPSLAPFALIGIRHPSWWFVACVVALLSLPMLPLWFDYATAVRNAEASLLFSIGSVPAMLLPVVAFLGRRRPGEATSTTREVDVVVLGGDGIRL